MLKKVTLPPYDFRAYVVLVAWVLGAAAVALASVEGGLWTTVIASWIGVSGATIATRGGTAWRQYDPPRTAILAISPILGSVVYAGGVYVGGLDGPAPWISWGGAALVSAGILLVVIGAVPLGLAAAAVAFVLLAAGVSVGWTSVNSFATDQVLRGWGEILMCAALVVAAGVAVLATRAFSGTGLGFAAIATPLGIAAVLAYATGVLLVSGTAGGMLLDIPFGVALVALGGWLTFASVRARRDPS